MAKIEVKLNPELDKNSRGFIDVKGKQDLRPKEYKKGQTFKVEHTSFVQTKIRTGELIVVNSNPEEKKS